MTEQPPVQSGLFLNVFGPPAVSWAGQPLHFPTKKALALFIYLALTKVPQARSRLAMVFWPDVDEVHSRANLRRTVTYLKQAFAPIGTLPIEAQREVIGLTRLVLDPNIALQID